VALESGSGIKLSFENWWCGAEPIAPDLAAARNALGLFPIFRVGLVIVIL
jgi:hypothetical protein